MATRTGPGVTTTIFRLSPTVENIAGKPIRMAMAGITSHIEMLAATHAMISTANRVLADSGLSYGLSNVCPGLPK